MAVKIRRRALQGLGIAAFLVMTAIALLIWRLHAGGHCFPFGDIYTPIGELAIDKRPYYVYGAVAGFEDKVRFVQISAREIPEVVCKPEHTPQLVTTETVADTKAVAKVVVRRKPGGGLDLSLEYSSGKQRDPSREWEGIAVELR